MKISANKVYKLVIHKPAHSLFIFIYTGFILNYFFLLLSFSFGVPIHEEANIFGTFDLFGDYFKVALSYPHSYIFQLNETSALFNTYIIENPYGGVAALRQGEYTHFHLTPLSTLFSLLNLKLMHYFDPMILFVSLISLIVLLAYFFLRAHIPSKTDATLFFFSFILCYPTLFFIARGNVFSCIVAFSLIAYLVLIFKNKYFFLALLLLAVAVNIRPNAIIFILALFINENKSKFTGLIYFILFTTAIFFSSLTISNALYPEYTAGHFLDGLKVYHSMFVVGDGGLASGSSFFGGLKSLFGYSKYFEFIASGIGALLLFCATFFMVHRKLSKPIYLFILCSLYTLCSSVFANYHLMVFLGPILNLYIASNKTLYDSPILVTDRDFLIIFFSCLFVLIPKNYLMYGDVSFQVILNPLFLFAVTVLLLSNLAYSWRLDQS